MVKVVMGNFAQPTTEAATITVANSATDPVPTCQLTLYDATSSINPLFMQELLILDDQQIPNPTINLAVNPTLNPYNGSGWGYSSYTGITPSQNGGGGMKLTFSNCTAPINTAQTSLSQLVYVTASQTYCLSVTVAGTSPVNIAAGLQLQWLDAGSNVISTSTSSQLSATGTNRYAFSAQAPATAVFCYIILTFYVTNATNSGSITYTNVQFEPQWFSSLSYPTPFCGPSQSNCRQLPIGYWIRQYRKFAGFVNFRTFRNYRGNARDVLIKAVGYAWILGTAYDSTSYTNQYDSYIISNLLSTFITATIPANPTPVALVDTTNVIQGMQFGSFASNWDDMRTRFNNAVASSGFFWSIDYYWAAISAPPGYVTMPIKLVADASGAPDNVTTFPAYGVEADMDFTQPGCLILTFGASGFSAQVNDPATLAQIATNSGYQFAIGHLFARKVNDSTLGANSDCTNRCMAELLQYDGPRYLYRYVTNVELIAGQGIAVTDAQNGLNNTVLLIQQVASTWLGKSETLADTWEYRATLGAVNRQVTNILSRLARQSNANTSTPAINVTTLAVLERIGVTDTVASTSVPTGYQAIVLGDGPLAYYRLDEAIGTIADDFSGHAEAGTLNGGVTLLATGLLSLGSDTAMSFDGTSGYISLLTTGTWPTGNGAWSIECWCKPTNSTNTNNAHLITIGNPGTPGAVGSICQTSSGGWGIVTWGGAGHDFQGNGTSTAGQIYYIVGTYDGASHLDLYVWNNAAMAHYGPFNCGTLNLSAVHQAISGFNSGGGQTFFFPGVIDEVAVYGSKLSAVQTAIHYAAGTSKYARLICQDLPLAYYRLGEASGTTANDSSGNLETGTINGGVTLGSTGALHSDSNTAMTFNGSTGYVSLPTAFLPSGAATWSVEAWIKLSSTPTGYSMILSWGQHVSGGAMELGFNPSGQPYVGFAFLGGPSGSVLTNNVYHHIAGTYDGTTARLYIDGTLINSGAFAGNISTTSEIAYIARGTDSASWLGAVIDEPAIYNYVLSATQISNHYTVGTS